MVSIVLDLLIVSRSIIMHGQTYIRITSIAEIMFGERSGRREGEGGRGKRRRRGAVLCPKQKPEDARKIGCDDF